MSRKRHDLRTHTCTQTEIPVIRISSALANARCPLNAGAGRGPPTHKRRIAGALLSLTPVNSPSKSMLVAAAEHRSRHRPCKGKSSLGLSSLPLKAVSRADEIRHVDPSGPVQAQAMCCTCMSIHRSSPSNGIPPHPRTAQRRHGFQSP